MYKFMRTSKINIMEIRFVSVHVYRAVVARYSVGIYNRNLNLMLVLFWKF